MREWWKFTAWPWIRDRAWPGFIAACTFGMGAWWDAVEEHPGVAVTNIFLGVILCAGASLYL